MQQVTAQLPWGTPLVQIDRLNTRDESDRCAAPADTQGRKTPGEREFSGGLLFEKI